MRTMDSVEAGAIFIILAILTGILGLTLTAITQTFSMWSLASGTTYYTSQPYVVHGIIFISVAASWGFSGGVLTLIDRDVDVAGGLTILVLGILGLILWGVFGEQR